MSDMTNFSDFLRGVLPAKDISKINPIVYLHDPLRAAKSNAGTFLRRTSRHFPTSKEQNTNDKSYWVTFTPIEAERHFPYLSGITPAYENVFWRQMLDVVNELLDLIQSDKSEVDSPLRDGTTLRHVCMSTGVRHDAHMTGVYFAKANAMMYPFCEDPRRLELINVLMIMLWGFDDKCEKGTREETAGVLHEWRMRLASADRGCIESSPLQTYLDKTIAAIYEYDRVTGSTAGREMHHAALNIEYWLKPPANCENHGEYLAYRHRNVGALFVWSCVKFSLDLKVDTSAPRIAEWLGWASMHLGMTNDLYSWAKEAKEQSEEQGPANAILHLQQLLSLDERQAVEMLYSMILQKEALMYEQLLSWKNECSFDDDMWAFLRGVWATLAGMYCTVRRVLDMLESRAKFHRNKAQQLVDRDIDAEFRNGLKLIRAQ
ncbi:hypothetical protein COCCADRAFT_29452 [Bipolaris zeicola 26-R-13]|uniref:Terpene synthase n=1 Tax=Cochliobolus carbonum (strain 26-R-13) TaxID=930089 RepID=W6XUP0_COCC2|nr:uncharacterized protein COCCADRAFT_29452 [Bipolaris zeicola 26-R-13]EUC29463.1 hypothetical protein COCCADRAFT_29452 [Bipolaris zeicola 26-R-13]